MTRRNHDVSGSRRSALTPLLTAVATLAMTAAALAIHPQRWTHTAEADFEPGEPDGVVVTNLGDLKLAAASVEVAPLPDETNIIYDIRVMPGGDTYLAAGPEGRLLRLRTNTVGQIAHLPEEEIFALDKTADGALLVAISGSPSRLAVLDGDNLKTLVKLESVRYIWDLLVMGNDVYLATGTEGQLLHVNLRQVIVADAAPADGAGPVAADGPADADADHQSDDADKPRPLPAGVTLIVDTPQANLLCVDRDGQGRIYLGTDTDGLVYRVEPNAAGGPEAFVVYDAAEPEIAALLVAADGAVYAGTADAEQAKPGRLEAAAKSETGRPAPNRVDLPVQPRPDPKKTGPESPDAPGSPEPAKTPAATPDAPKPSAPDDNAVPSVTPKPSQQQYDDLRQEIRRRLEKARQTGELQTMPSTPRPGPVGGATGGRRTTPAASRSNKSGNAVYRIAPGGFVTEIFRESVMVLRLLADGDDLLIATGNEGQVFRVDVRAEETSIVADLAPAQVPALARDGGGNILIGTGSAASLRRLSGGYAPNGAFTSDVLDAGQISLWGKLLVTADLPDGASLNVQTRSGNVQDPQRAAWSKWSVPRTIVPEAGLVGPAPRELPVTSPPARFMQYRLTLTGNGVVTPVVDRIELAYVVPNIRPAVSSITAQYAAATGTRSGTAKDDDAEPQSKMSIQWKAEDANSDALLYTLHYRLVGRGNWLPLAEDIDQNKFEWDTRRVPDGRYIIRITATDSPDNPKGMDLSSSRLSDPVLIDNTPPTIGDRMQKIDNGAATLTFAVADALSPIESVKFAVDSTDDWQAVLPDDLIYDSTREAMTVKIPGLAPGSHVVTLRATDSLGNSQYVSELIEIK